MNEVSAVEQGLQRVIGLGDEPDRRPDGLDDDALLAIHRSLVRLRTYDERSVVYHRQGRIGTYAIFRGHEAIQAGAVHALEDRDWIFPSYRDSAIGLLRGLPAATILQWWRGHPSGWWNPEDVNVASICVPIATQVPHAAGLAWGLKLKGSEAVALTLFGDGATSEGAFHEGVNIAAVDEGAARPPLQQQPVGDLDAAERPDRRRAAVGQGGRLRHPGDPGGRARRARRPRGGRRGSERALARATGRRSSRP